MKALILSNICLSDEEISIIRDEKKTFKLALNHHAEIMRPNARIFADYVDLARQHLNFPNEKIYSIRASSRTPSHWIIKVDIPFKGSTIVVAIELLMRKGYREILLVADNTVHGQEFRDEIYDNVGRLSKKVKLYQIREGYFPLETKDLKDFLWNT